MIEIMATGKIVKAFQGRTSSNGNPFVIGHVLAISQQRERQILSCISFNNDVIDLLLKLGVNDSVCIIGDATPKSYVDRDGEVKTGIDVLVHQAMSIYQINKKKKAISTVDENIVLPTEKEVITQFIPPENEIIEEETITK